MHTDTHDALMSDARHMSPGPADAIVFTEGGASLVPVVELRRRLRAMRRADVAEAIGLARADAVPVLIVDRAGASVRWLARVELVHGGAAGGMLS
jgi:hypothetical protein